MIHNAILSHVENIAIPRHRLNNEAPFASFPIPPFSFHFFGLSLSLSLSLSLFFSTSASFFLYPFGPPRNHPTSQNWIRTPCLRGFCGTPRLGRFFAFPWNKVNSSFFAALSTPLFLLASPLRATFISPRRPNFNRDFPVDKLRPRIYYLVCSNGIR